MLLWTIATVWLFMTLTWLYATAICNVSIVDTIYGINFILIHITYYYLSPNTDRISLLLFALTSLWAIRLSTHIGIKNYGLGEEKRYQRFREKYGKQRYWWFSYFQVFLLQGAFLLIFASPIHMSYQSPITQTSHLQTLMLAIGISIFLLGFIYESIADWQLRQFKKHSKPLEFLQTGLWKYSRHPNYFGEITLWFGIAIISFSKSPSLYGLLNFIGPLFLTYVIAYLSGPKNHEPYMEKEKPGYLKYQNDTPTIIPKF